MKTQSFVMLLGLLASQFGHATVIDLRSAGGNGGGYGNSLQFSQDGIAVDVFGFAETGPATASGNLFRSAEVWSGVRGVGVCNREEGLILTGGCNETEHEVDTVGNDDLVVFYFDQTVQFDFLTVDPQNGPGDDPTDRDIIYWVGQTLALPDFRQLTFDTLKDIAGFGDETLNAASASLQYYKHELSGVGNILVMSGNYHDKNCVNAGGELGCEAYKLAGVNVTAVPEPASAWVLSSGILALAAAMRRRRKERQVVIPA